MVHAILFGGLQKTWTLGMQFFFNFFSLFSWLIVWINTVAGHSPTMYKISTCAVGVNSKHPISKFDNSKIAAPVLVSFAAAQAGITQCSLPPQPCPRAWRDSGWEGDYSSLSRRSFRSCGRLLQSIGRQSVYDWLTDHQHILSWDNCWYLSWLSFHKSTNSRPI